MMNSFETDELVEQLPEGVEKRITMRDVVGLPSSAEPLKLDYDIDGRLRLHSIQFMPARYMFIPQRDIFIPPRALMAIDPPHYTSYGNSGSYISFDTWSSTAHYLNFD
jgi:hypothetical protein